MNRRRHKRLALAWFVGAAVLLAADIALYFVAPDLRFFTRGTAVFCAFNAAWHMGWLARDRRDVSADGEVRP